MDKIWLTLQLWMGVFCIILLIKVWIMTNDIKEIKNYISSNNHSMTKEIEQIKNYFIQYMTERWEEGSVVYSRKDHKKYTVVKVLPNEHLLLDDNPIKTNIVDLPIREVIKKGSEVYDKKDFKKYKVVNILSDGMLLLYDDDYKEVKLSIDDIHK